MCLSCGYNNISLEACCFTPDSTFVMIGEPSTSNAMKMAVLDGKHSLLINTL
ncbi:unnamed protein product [Oncorhynchus mykiss]|uniref:Uncharacterized protein n=1 Tax=Oncorhynchus mykiss TaxID=8022 RepID=A0A060X4Y2_ONCMY|nr:unnamed protein product [Oncorhynchus mykiss]